MIKLYKSQNRFRSNGVNNFLSHLKLEVSYLLNTENDIYLPDSFKRLIEI